MRLTSITAIIRSFRKPKRWWPAESWARSSMPMVPTRRIGCIWRLMPEFSGESRAVADVGSHWCDCIQFITGRKITKVFGDLRTIHKTRMKPKKEVETYSGKLLQPSDYQPVEINTEDYATVL